ncbi:MAG: trehalose-phosphatase [Rugosibacter sp.]|nr:MAG: trehalose-phosphatase [Rugosibacter sp.]
MTNAPPKPSADWAYFLDVDGTLIDLAPTPEEVFVDRDLLWLIENAHSLCNGAVALVSGRSLVDLDSRLGMPLLPMAGLHGLEWRNTTTGRIQRRVVPANNIQEIRGKLLLLQQRYPQLIVEDKGETLALHYRKVPRLGGYLHRLIQKLVNMTDNNLQVQPGKRVIEIKPKGYDKGSAIETFMATPPFAGRTPVFIGDDLTDEHGFDVINRLGGISIKVGRGKTQALFHLPSVEAVHEWLEQIALSSEMQIRGEKIAIT